MAATIQTGGPFQRPLNLAILAEAYGRIAKTEQGLSLIAEALAMIEETDQREFEAELHRLKETLLLKQAVQAYHLKGKPLPAQPRAVVFAPV